MTTRSERLADALYAELLAWADSKRWRGTTHKEVPLDEVKRCFGAVHQRRETDDSTAALIKASLVVLAERKLIVAVKGTDRERIELPRKIRIVPVITTSRRTVPTMPAWHRSLYDLEDTWSTASDKQRLRYSVINRWLMSDPDRKIRVPLRERALEMFSAFGSEEDFAFPEKALDGMRDGPLFGDQQRLLRLLNAVATPPPLLSRQPLNEVAPNQLVRVGDGDLMLVLENSATWWSIVQALPSHHNLGHVAWGLGASFMSSIRSVADNHEIRRIRYFGDLDVSGLRIPVIANRAAGTAGLPPVEPATELYKTLFTVGRSWRSGDKAVERDTAQELAAWLPSQHREDTTCLLTTGRRIAQEWVGCEQLGRSTNWHADLI